MIKIYLERSNIYLFVIINAIYKAKYLNQTRQSSSVENSTYMPVSMRGYRISLLSREMGNIAQLDTYPSASSSLQYLDFTDVLLRSETNS